MTLLISEIAEITKQLIYHSLPSRKAYYIGCRNECSLFNTVNQRCNLQFTIIRFKPILYEPIWVSQAHKLGDKIHDIDLSTMDAKTVGEVRFY